MERVAIVGFWTDWKNDGQSRARARSIRAVPDRRHHRTRHPGSALRIRYKTTGAGPSQSLAMTQRSSSVTVTFPTSMAARSSRAGMSSALTSSSTVREGRRRGKERRRISIEGQSASSSARRARALTIVMRCYYRALIWMRSIPSVTGSSAWRAVRRMHWRR